MKYFMYANGMPFDGNTISQGKSLGGSETMAYLVARELAKRDHTVFMFTNLPEGEPTRIDGVNYLPIGAVDQQRHPYGSNFERHARDIPSDVILAQRIPGVFSKPYNSKLNYFWAHDLALKRFQPHTNSMLWNIDRYLAVSDFHRDQVKQVLHLPEGMTHTLPNGIDLDLWRNPMSAEQKIGSKAMLYGARPERGLINLVKEDGVMEKLLKYDPEIKLLVCTYDNNHQSMEGLYNYLYTRCQQLPNVENIGPQSHQSLAEIEKNCWLYVYPTDFEDTSCLMVMQNAAAGTPFVASKAGALTETAEGSGVYWSDIDQFEKAVIYLNENPDKWKQLHKKSLDKAKDYGIEKTVDRLEAYVVEDFAKLTADKQKLYDHFIYTSDIYAADLLQATHTDEISTTDMRKRYKTDKVELSQTQEFYNKSAERNFDIGNKHGMEDPARLLGMARLQPVIHQLSKLKPEAKVLDYGTCVGQLAFALKTKFSDMEFVCTDISQAQLDVGEAYAKEKEISGITFKQCNNPAELEEKDFDAVLCLEVLEHVWEHSKFLVDLSKLVKPGGRVILSTPFGPYEENSDDPDPLYQHLHNFEEADIVDMVGEKDDLSIVYIGDQDSKKGERLGNYVWSWEENNKVGISQIDWCRKFKQQRPREQVSCCMIVRTDGNTLRRCLESVKPLYDELILGVDDPDWSDRNELCLFERYAAVSEKLVYQIGRQFGAKFIPIESPLTQGFASARNQTIAEATKDWVLWIDDDETFVYPDRFLQFIRASAFDSFSINHHHISAEPVGLLKTDHPARLFRNNKDIKFFGVVHEHPETKVNEGPGQTFVVPQELACIMHYGYETEDVRRKRFIRNYPLMQRDRELYPDRKLGKFLWIRDLSHMNRFIMERNGGQVTEDVIKNCQEAIKIWREELETTNLRMVQDSLQYISECASILTNNQGFQFRITIDLNYRGLGDDLNKQMNPMLHGIVETQEDLNTLYKVLLRDKLNAVEVNQKYI